MHYHGRTTFSLRSLNPSYVFLRFFVILGEPSTKVRLRQRYRGNCDFILLFIFIVQEILVQLFVEIGHFQSTSRSLSSITQTFYYSCRLYRLQVMIKCAIPVSSYLHLQSIVKEASSCHSVLKCINEKTPLKNISVYDNKNGQTNISTLDKNVSSDEFINIKSLI